MAKITRGVGEHGQEVMFKDGERIISVSGLFKALGVDADLSKVPQNLLERAIDIGNKTHTALETLQKGHADADVKGCLDSFHKWFNSDKGTLHTIRADRRMAEKTEQDKINGVHIMARIDAVFMIDGKKVAVDYKTGSKIYPTNKVQVEAQKQIFDCDAGATLQLFKDGSIAELKYHDEEELLNNMLAIYRDNNELDRILLGQALFNDGSEIPKDLAEEYIFIDNELKIMEDKKEKLKARIAEFLGNSKGSYDNGKNKLVFNRVAGKKTKKRDFKKMKEDGIDVDFYETTTQGDDHYKASVKEVKNEL